jgi:hypothetical protein
MKLFIAEEEKNNIRNMYGIISEQTACNWEDYQNGDGISRPKININKTENGVSASYQGPETGFCIQHAKGSTSDSIHQLAGVVRKVVSEYLKELYNSQNYVYPVLENIIMTKRNNFFSIKVPFAKTTEDKAITNFNERGGWGHDGSNTLQQFLSSISDETKYALIDVVKKVASGGNSPDITENWVSFRDIQKFPIKTSGLEPEQPNTETPEPSEPNKTETPKPAESPKPVVSKPAESPKPAVSKPAESPKPAVSKPAESPKSVAPNTPETKGPQRARIMTINPKDW